MLIYAPSNHFTDYSCVTCLSEAVNARLSYVAMLPWRANLPGMFWSYTASCMYTLQVFASLPVAGSAQFSWHWLAQDDTSAKLLTQGVEAESQTPSTRSSKILG